MDGGSRQGGYGEMVGKSRNEWPSCFDPVYSGDFSGHNSARKRTRRKRHQIYVSANKKSQ